VQLTQKTDYAIRSLIYLTLNPLRRVPAREISESFNISYHHIVKTVQLLISHDLIESRNGKGGGLMLKADPKDITLGQVVKLTETNFDLLECFNEEKNTCQLNGMCAVKGVMMKAKNEFIKVLDKVTLEQVSHNKDQIRGALIKT
jgi:Rrf2 family transcriptional regulator, nitric oxide-sensitive transcriptional repressor